MRIDKRKLSILAWLGCLVSLALIAEAGYIFYANQSAPGHVNFPLGYTEIVLTLGYGIVAMLILGYQPGHGIGWLFLVIFFLSAFNLFARQYAVYGLLVATLPGAIWMAWLQSWLFYLIFPAPIILLVLLFPDGRLSSPRWRLLVWLGILSTVFLIVGRLVKPGLLIVHVNEGTIMLGVNNPTGVKVWTGLIKTLNTGWVLAMILFPAALFAPILRYRRARGVERQQLKWFVYFAILTLLFLPLAFIESADVGELFLLFLMLILPAATAMAILRYRLYDIDIIIRRTLVFGALTVLLIVAYFGSVVLLQQAFRALSGQNSPVAIVISTLVIAALFNPLRGRVQDTIDRRFYRSKYNAQQALADFAATARDEVELDQITAELLLLVEQTVQPDRLSLWIKNAGDLNPGDKFSGEITKINPSQSIP
jgi:hypothetical protein